MMNEQRKKWEEDQHLQAEKKKQEMEEREN